MLTEVTETELTQAAWRQAALCPPHSSPLPGTFVVLLTWGFTPWGSQLLSADGGWPGQAGMGSTLELLFLEIEDGASRAAGPSSDAGEKFNQLFWGSAVPGMGR